MVREEIAWAGGLFEGEGCITSSQPTKSLRRIAEVKVQMTDEEPVRRFHQAIGPLGHVHRVHSPSRRQWKPYYVWRTAKFEHVQAVIAMLWPYLGERRKSQAKTVLTRLS